MSSTVYAEFLWKIAALDSKNVIARGRGVGWKSFRINGQREESELRRREAMAGDVSDDQILPAIMIRSSDIRKKIVAREEGGGGSRLEVWGLVIHNHVTQVGCQWSLIVYFFLYILVHILQTTDCRLKINQMVKLHFLCLFMELAWSQTVTLELWILDGTGKMLNLNM
jgi:hypothetical protein